MGDRGEWDAAAREAAREVGRAVEVGEQLGLFGGPEPAAEPAWDGRGRKPGSRNKGKVGLAEYMAAQGWRAPGEALALAAGLTERGDPMEIAFRRAAWLRSAAGLAPDPASLASMAFAIWREQNAAAAQLLPYTLQRLAPQEGPRDAAQLPSIGIAPASAAVGSASERPRLAPADVRWRSEQDQGVSGEADPASDGSPRTGGASD